MIIQKETTSLVVNNAINILAKWLLIIFVVLTAFMVILLGLGYLLNENEKSTTLLKTQLEQEFHAEKLKQEKREKQRAAQETPIEITTTDDIIITITPNAQSNTQVIYP